MGKAKRLKAARRIAEELTVGHQGRGFVAAGLRNQKTAEVANDTTRGVYRRIKRSMKGTP